MFVARGSAHGLRSKKTFVLVRWREGRLSKPVAGGSRPMIHRSKKRPPRFNSRRTASCPWNPAGNPWRCGRVIWHGVCHQAQVAAQGGRLLEALEMLQAERTERWMRKRIKFCCGALNRKTEGCGLTLSVVESQVDNPFFLQESHGKSSAPFGARPSTSGSSGLRYFWIFWVEERP